MKHQLCYRGAPHDPDTALIHKDTKVTSGVGRALCSCGWLSEDLDSGAARRRAHQEHVSTKHQPAPEDQATARLDYTGPPHLFWRVLGTQAMRYAAAQEGVKTVFASTATRQIEISGDRKAVSDTVREIRAFWRRALKILDSAVPGTSDVAILREWLSLSGEPK